MAKESKEKIKYILLFLTGILFSNCANQLPPGGGEVDNIPPEIIELYPANGTINFDDEYFELGFSEYVDKRSVKDAIFISPAIEGSPELDWSGKYVRVYFPYKLKDSTTYVVTIGTDVVDYNNRNRMAQAYTFAFSTGNVIDNRTITGRVFADEPEGVLIFAYKLSGDINPAEVKPDYISQSGVDGSFKLGGLAAGTYRIFAVKDQFRDLLFQSGQDLIGNPFKDIALSETDSLYSNLNFFLSKADTTAPRLINAVMTDANHILVNLTEEFDSTILKSINFHLYDSTASLKHNVKYAYKGNSKAAEFVLVIDSGLSAENSIYLIADSLKDKMGNIYLNDYVLITVTERPDTTAPSIIKTFPAANTNQADFQNQKFYFLFNDAFDSSAVKDGITFKDTFDFKIPYTINFIDDASFEIISTKKLDAAKDYIIEIDFSKFEDAAGNKLDSVYQYKFRTITGLEFTGVSGIILKINEDKNYVAILESVENENKYQQKAAADGSFSFQRVLPGKYRLWAFEDSDSSGTYNYGWPYPFKSAEEFSFYPDTLNLRARWTQTDLKFNFR